MIKIVSKRSGIPYEDPQVAYKKALNAEKSNKPGGILSALLGFSASGNSGKGKGHNGRCNGDCANCPPHYGYRYGRWYYGHQHTDGCEFGGNGGTRM